MPWSHSSIELQFGSLYSIQACGIVTIRVVLSMSGLTVMPDTLSIATHSCWCQRPSISRASCLRPNLRTNSKGTHART
ncbi:hypothetical protein D3C78_1712120 [compost metagenome]